MAGSRTREEEEAWETVYAAAWAASESDAPTVEVRTSDLELVLNRLSTLEVENAR